MATAKNDVYQIVTDKILEMLDKGTVPWQKPWKGGAQFCPKGYSSRKGYRGINHFLLACEAMDKGYSSRYWVTFNQAKKQGGKVRKGEKSTVVVFWKWLDIVDTDESTGETKKKKIPFLRYFRVFNLDQVDGIKAPKDGIQENLEVIDFNPIAAAEQIVDGMPQRPEITHNEQRAYYRPATDTVNMPKADSFKGEGEYYSTLFHELTHSTKHQSRLDRKEDQSAVAAFGSYDYGKEELIAEMGAAFLCGESGIDNTMENSAAYIDGWRRNIKADKKLVVMAAAQAQKAADFILNRKTEYKAD